VAGSRDQVHYHQLGQEEDQEDQENPLQDREIRRVIRQPDQVMELSIYNRRLFLGCVVALDLVGLVAISLTVHWVLDYKGGLPSAGPGIHFNWHPILMTSSLVFLYGNGALIYRLIPPRSDAHKLKLKIGHAAVMMVAFCLMVIGLQAAFDSHNLATPPKPNMYTLHSWVGLLAALLFGCQWTLGFAAFLFPKFSPEIRSFLLPFHQYFGTAILGLSVAAALMGHLEKQIWSNQEYSQKNAEANLVNWTGMLLIIFAVGVTFLISKFSKEKTNEFVRD